MTKDAGSRDANNEIGGRTLLALDPAIEAWLKDGVTKSYDEFAADPGAGISGEKVMGRLRTTYRAHLAARDT